MYQTDIWYTNQVRVTGYVRVSTAEQADSGAGLEAQRQAIEQACAARSWTLEAIHEDAGISGKSLARPGLARALRSLETGEVDGLVVAKVDRLSRSLLDFAQLLEDSRRKGWKLVVLDLGVDTSTPSGELIASTMAGFSQFERRLIGQRTKDALAVKKAQGVQLGRPRLLPQEVVDEILRRRTAGDTLKVIADDFNVRRVPTAQGGRAWWPTTVRKVALSARGDSTTPPELSQVEASA